MRIIILFLIYKNGKLVDRTFSVQSNSDNRFQNFKLSINMPENLPSQGKSDDINSLDNKKPVLGSDFQIESPIGSSFFYSTSFISSNETWRWALDFTLSGFIAQLQGNALAGLRIDDMDSYAGNRYAGCWLMDGAGWACIVASDWNEFLSFLNQHQNNYRIKDIEVHQISTGQFLYSAVFKQDGLGWGYYINVNNTADLYNWINSEQLAGRHPVDFDVIKDGNNTYLSCITASTNVIAWRWVTYWDASTYFAEASSLNAQNFCIVQQDQIYDGTDYKYFAIWEKYNGYNAGGYDINNNNQNNFVNNINNLGAMGYRPIMFDNYYIGALINVNQVTSEIPEKYSLQQNFPNPFNPTTNIKFGIPKSGLVTIKIYDLIGRETTTLVNESLNPGTYSVNFDGTGFTNGIYFYRLEAKNYKETKKMLLIK